MKLPRRDPLTLPYGIWHLGDRAGGGEILFSRDYRALWHRLPAERMDGTKRVPGVVKQVHFHQGGRVDRKLIMELIAAEADFVAGKEIIAPICPLDCGGRRRAPVPKTEVTRPFLRLIVNNSEG